MENDTIINSKIENLLQLINEDEITDLNESVSSVLKNPAVKWAKFILTDDLPNENKQRIPLEEFDNLIKSGIFMPIKMAANEIKDGHEDSKPLGVITHLKKAGNQIRAIAALWTKERPEDIKIIEDALNSNKPINVSWEILYGDFSINDAGITELKDTALGGVSIVGMPAYAGRTRFLALASMWSAAYLKELPDDAFLYVSEGETEVQKLFPVKDKEGNVVKQKVEEAIATIPLIESFSEKEKKQLIKKASKLLEEKEKVQQENIVMEENTLDELELSKQKIGELEAAIAEKDAIIAQKDEELKTLSEFKASVETKEAEAAKFSEIKNMFTEAGLNKPESYFEENKEKLLALDKGDLEFMIQEFIAFSSAKPQEKSADSSVIPPITGEPKELSIKELAEGLRKLRS